MEIEVPIQFFKRGFILERDIDKTYLFQSKGRGSNFTFQSGERGFKITFFRAEEGRLE